MANKPLALLTSFLATSTLVFLQDSNSNAGAPVLFAHTEEEGFWEGLCVLLMDVQNNLAL